MREGLAKGLFKSARPFDEDLKARTPLSGVPSILHRYIRAAAPSLDPFWD